MVKLTRKLGIIMMIIGIAFQFLNIITYGYWGIDIDVIGALIFIIGLIVTIIKWKTPVKKRK
jgi:hypothetical protein